MHVCGVRTAIQGVHVAVKKKAAVKKTAKKAVAKKSATKKTVAKKATTKKATTKSAVKKSATKKAVAKKATSKGAVKKTTAKKVAKKATAKRAVKKSASKASSAKFTVPPVPTTSVRPVSAPVAPVAPTTTRPAAPVAPKPVATPKQGTSGRVVIAVVAGIVLLGAIVWSQSNKSDDDSAAPAPSVSAAPSESATPSETETTSGEAVASVEAPTNFIGTKSADGYTLRWGVPAATAGLTGFNVEIRPNGTGDWVTIATVSPTQTSQAVTRTDPSGWTQFRVTSVYSDGQTASAKVFGFSGQIK